MTIKDVGRVGGWKAINVATYSGSDENAHKLGQSIVIVCADGGEVSEVEGWGGIGGKNK